MNIIGINGRMILTWHYKDRRCKILGDVKRKLFNQIESYISGDINRFQFKEISEAYYTNNVKCIEGTKFHEIYKSIVPDACLFYIDEPCLSEEEKENGFRSSLEEAYKLLSELFEKNGYK